MKTVKFPYQSLLDFKGRGDIKPSINSLLEIKKILYQNHTFKKFSNILSVKTVFVGVLEKMLDQAEDSEDTSLHNTD